VVWPHPLHHILTQIEPDADVQGTMPRMFIGHAHNEHSMAEPCDQGVNVPWLEVERDALSTAFIRISLYENGWKRPQDALHTANLT